MEGLLLGNILSPNRREKRKVARITVHKNKVPKCSSTLWITPNQVPYSTLKSEILNMLSMILIFFLKKTF